MPAIDQKVHEHCKAAAMLVNADSGGTCSAAHQHIAESGMHTTADNAKFLSDLGW